MELAFIFCIGWVVSHAFGEKRDEYSASQEGHRDKYLAKLGRSHPSWGHARRERYLHNAARRNAAGHWAYLLRHGWSSTFNDFAHGWNNAKTAHGEWKAERPEDRPSPWRMLKSGWNDNSRRRKEEVAAAAREVQTVDTPPATDTEPIWTAVDVMPERDREYDERMLAAKEEAHRLMLESFPKVRDELTEDELAEHMRNRRRLESDIANLRQILGKPAADPWLDEDEARNARIYPWPTTDTPGETAGSTNGAPMTTQTATAAEAHSVDDVRRNSAAFVQGLQTYRNQAEQLLADTMRFAGNDRESIALLQQSIEALDGAIAGFGRMPTSLNKHVDGEEYASRGHAVNDINALKTS